MALKGTQQVAEEVRYLYRPLFLNFVSLAPVFEKRQSEHRLKDFAGEALPIPFNCFVLMGKPWPRPRVPARLCSRMSEPRRRIAAERITPRKA